MIKKLDHIGIAVKDIDEALLFYSDLMGLDCTLIEEIPEQKVKIAFVAVGEVNIELIQASVPDSPITKFIERRGEGIHHIALQVEDIEEVISTLSEAGAELLDHTPRKGSHHSRIAFLHPRSAHGVLIELVDRVFV